MKKTLITLAVGFTVLPLSATFAAPGGPNPDDDVASLTQSSISRIGGAGTTAAATTGGITDADGNPVVIPATATATYSGSNDIATTGSFNPLVKESFNDVNSDNWTNIREDGVLSIGNGISQALANSDIDNNVGGPQLVPLVPGVPNPLQDQGNVIFEDSALQNGAQAVVANLATRLTTTRTNSIDTGSYNHASGISVVEQNLGIGQAMTQSAVVQSNGGL